VWIRLWLGHRSLQLPSALLQLHQLLLLLPLLLL
jgi:hypothetical protein